MVLVCLTVIGYLHDANTWSSDGKGFVRPANVAMWKTELILGVALAVPLLNTLAHVIAPESSDFRTRVRPRICPVHQFLGDCTRFMEWRSGALSCNGCDHCRLGRTGGVNAVCIRIGCGRIATRRAPG
jgi:hypothetical protein